LYFLPDKGG